MLKEHCLDGDGDNQYLIMIVSSCTLFLYIAPHLEDPTGIRIVVNNEVLAFFLTLPIANATKEIPKFRQLC